MRPVAEWSPKWAKTRQDSCRHLREPPQLVHERCCPASVGKAVGGAGLGSAPAAVEQHSPSLAWGASGKPQTACAVAGGCEKWWAGAKGGS